MFAVRHLGLLSPLLLAALFVGCERADPFEPPIQAALAAGSGLTLTAPSGTAAVAASYNRIDVSWQDNSSGETGFEVHRSTSGPAGTFTLRASTGAGVTSYGDLGLTPSTQHCYKSRAVKMSGRKTSYSGFSGSACATTLVPPLPAAPSGTNATLTSGGTVAIAWIDNSSTEDGFRVERSQDGGGTWTTAHSIGADATSTTDYGRTVEQLVCYRVFAFNGQGDSPPSNSDCTTPPAGPTNLTATASDPQGIDLAWTDNSSVEEGYEVQRTDGIVAYTTIANLPANSTTYRDLGVISDITYRYVVWAKKDGGISEASNIASAAAATVPPNAPSGTEVTPSGSWVSVRWTDNSLNEDAFRIERSTDGGMTWATVATASYEFGDGPLPTEQQVCYRVFAFNDRDDSPPSNTDCTTPPAGPTNLTGTMIDEQTFELTWTDNSGVEDGFEVYVDTYPTCPGNSWFLLASIPANATSYRPGDWEWYPCVPTAYYVVAIKDGGYSDWSNPATP